MNLVRVNVLKLCQNGELRATFVALCVASAIKNLLHFLKLSAFGNCFYLLRESKDVAEWLVSDKVTVVLVKAVCYVIGSYRTPSFVTVVGQIT